MRRPRRGAAAAELGLVLPLVLLWLLGTVELARALHLRRIAVTAAHDGARAAGRVEGPAGDPAAELVALAEASARAVLEDAGIGCGDGCEVVATPTTVDVRWIEVSVTLPYAATVDARWAITSVSAQAAAPCRRQP
jgi:Flp pilus assembly protein TadG